MFKDVNRMRVQIIGVRKEIRDEILKFFRDLQERGYVYQVTWSHSDDRLYNIQYDMSDMMIYPILDGIELQRRGYKYDSYYIDSCEFIEIKII